MTGKFKLSSCAAVAQWFCVMWRLFCWPIGVPPLWPHRVCCSKIAEAEAAVSVNKKKWLVMHMHVQLKLDELRGFLQRLVLLATLALVAYGIYSSGVQ